MITDKIKSIDINVQTGEETIVYFTEQEWAEVQAEATPALEG